MNRRSFLARLGLTAGAGATIATGAAISLATASEENPELLAFGEQMILAIARVREARGHHLAAVAEFHSIRPHIPLEIKDRSLWVDLERRCSTGLGNVHLRDGFGQTVWEDKRPVVFVSALNFRDRLARMDARTALARRYKRLLSVAERFEAEDAAARSATRVDELFDELLEGQIRLASLCDKLFGVDARTMIGIEIKAGAIGIAPLLTACGKGGPLRWGPQLADNLLSVLSREV